MREIDRLPLPRIAIIGAGMGGIAAAIKLRADGNNVTVYERAQGLGGVWRDNRYPGAECDVPSFLYSFSFAPNRNWTRNYAGQAEILSYLEQTAADFGLAPHFRFAHELNAASWDEGSMEWRLEFTNGHMADADIVVFAVGQMSTPSIPYFPGAEKFAGAAFHTARWPEGLALEGKKLVVVGAGASVIQVVPEVAKEAAHVTVLQRAPGYVLDKDNAPVPREQSPVITKWRRYSSYWMKELLTPRLIRWPKLTRVPERRFRKSLRDWVPEDHIRESVEPKDRFGCKRILVSNEWYPALRRSNVAVRTETIDRVEEYAVVTTGGVRIPADVLVYGTGFQTSSFLHGIEVRGSRGTTLTDEWRGEPFALLGVSVPSFPNMFMMYGPNTNPAWNSVLFMLECQAALIVRMTRRWRNAGGAAIEARPEPTRRFREALDDRSSRSVWLTGCTNWYMSATGRNTQNWPSMATTYWLRTHLIRWSEFAVRRSPLRRNAR